MVNSFDCFFEKYKKLLREYTSSKKHVVDKPGKWTIIVVMSVIMLLCLLLLVCRMDDILCVCIAIALMSCCAILFANIDPYPSIGPDEKPYLNHVCRVMELLKEYGIDSRDAEKVKVLIDYANNMITRRDPLGDIRRAVVITGSAGAIITTVLSGALEGTINLVESIPYVIVILVLVFATVMFFSPISSFFAKLVFPDKTKYQKLIEDLSHILMFDMSSIIEEGLEANARQSNACNDEVKKQVAE